MKYDSNPMSTTKEEELDRWNIIKSYFNEKKIRNVVGQDIKFNKPENPDLIIKNNGSLKEFLDYSKIIAEKITKIDKI